MFNVNIRNRNSKIIFVAIGFLGTEFKAFFFAASISPWFGILLYKDFTSKVIRNVSSVMLSVPFILFVKSAVSVI